MLLAKDFLSRLRFEGCSSVIQEGCAHFRIPDAEKAMKYLCKSLCAALILATAVCRNDAAYAKENCTHTWGKGDYKSFKQVQDELQERLGSGKILRFSLCSNANDRYFQITVLDPSGKVRTLRLAAR